MPVFTSRLRPLRQRSRLAVLDFAPQDFKILEVFQIILIFICRSIFSVFGSSQSLRQGTNKDGVKQYSMPALDVEMPFRFSESDVEKYAKAVGARSAEDLILSPAQVCLIFFAHSSLVSILLFARPDCPIRPLGTVNVKNRFELLEPNLHKIDVLTAATKRFARAKFAPECRTVKRGVEVDLIIEVTELTEHRERLLFRTIFTMLQPMKTKTPPSAKEPEIFATLPDDKRKIIQTAFTLQLDEPSSWANISKDYNPIHLSQIAAKFFGFPSRIGHGNHVLAKAIRAVDEYEGMKARDGVNSNSWWLEVQFRRPALLPASLGVTKEVMQKEGATNINSYEIKDRKGRVVATAQSLLT